jgi:hypothetical protein
MGKFQRDSRIVQEAATKFADAVLDYFDNHPKGSLALVSRIKGSDGREVTISGSEQLVDLRPAK